MRGKDKISDKPRMDVEMVTEEVIIDKNFGRSNSRDRGRQNFRRNYNNNDRSRSKERSPTPRRYATRWYNSPNTNSGSRSRSNSRVTTNRDRIRCFRCREYDHCVNECPNTGIEDSDGYKSDSAALQLMATDIETHDSYDITRFTEEIEHLNWWKVRVLPPHFYLKRKKGGKVRFSDKVTYIPDKERVCLTKDQTKHIYEMVEMNKPVNIHAMNQDIGNDSKVRVKLEEGDNDSHLNPYQMAVLNKKTKEDTRAEQMTNWSIFSDKIKYVNSYMSMNPGLTIRPLEDRKHKRLY